MSNNNNNNQEEEEEEVKEPRILTGRFGKTDAFKSLGATSNYSCSLHSSQL